jgi:hypothetical protein
VAKVARIGHGVLLQVFADLAAGDLASYDATAKVLGLRSLSEIVVYAE